MSAFQPASIVDGMLPVRGGEGREVLDSRKALLAFQPALLMAGSVSKIRTQGRSPQSLNNRSSEMGPFSANMDTPDLRISTLGRH